MIDGLQRRANTSGLTTGHDGHPVGPSSHRLVDSVQTWLDGHRRLTLVTAAIVAAIVVAPTAMPTVARLTLAVFVVMLSLTAFGEAAEVTICLVALVALVLVGGSSVGDAVGAVTSHTVILLVGSFVVAAAAQRSGIAERLALAVGGTARSVDQLMRRITWVLIATAYLVPSTSGRAALMLPVFLAIADQVVEPRVRRALAVLFPTVILLSAVASLFGAGAHLVMTELVTSVGEDRIGVLEWTVYGLPVAALSSFMSLAVIRRMFLRPADRSARIDLTTDRAPWSRDERIATTVVVAMTAGWLSEPVHGVPAWLVATIGAVVVAAGPFRTITIRQARAALPLDLLFVMAVTAEAGSALARTGAADWIAISLLGPLVDRGGSTLLVVIVVTTVSLLAHLVVTSRTARASVLLPVVILVATAAGLDATAVAFLSTAAAGYCLTTTTSAKPMRVFSTVEDGYTEADLRRLSTRLLPLHLALFAGCAFTLWPALGLGLVPAADTRPAVSGSTATVDAPLPWDRIRVDGLDVGPRWSPSPTAPAASSATTTVTTIPATTTPATTTPTTTTPTTAAPMTTTPATATPATTSPATTTPTTSTPATTSAPAPTAPVTSPADDGEFDDNDNNDDNDDNSESDD